MKKRIFRILPLVILLAAALAACIRMDPEPAKLSGLVIMDSSITLDGKESVQTITYKVKLYNASLTSIAIDSMRTLVGDAFHVMLVDPAALTMKIGKNIRSGETMTLKGNFQIKTNGIPRDQLDRMGYLVQGFYVTTNQTLLLPGVPTSTPKPTKVPTTSAPTEKAEKPAKQAKPTQKP